MAVYSANSYGSLGNWQDNRRAFRLALKFAGVLLSVGSVALIGAWGYWASVQNAGGIPEIHPSSRPFKTLPADPGGHKNPYIGREINKLIGGSGEMPENPAYKFAPAVAELRTLDFSPRDFQERMRLLEMKSTAPEAEIAIQELVAEAASQAAAEPVESIWIAPERGRLIIMSVKYALIPEPDPAELGGGRIDLLEVAKGSHVVQLGDFAAESAASREWRKLRTEFAGFLSERAWFIQRANSGGKPLYRLRVSGFEDRVAAEGFCSRLTARQETCIPTIMR